ncbi:MAG: hypothetical protein M1833_003668 [Piccolia ochrophora]|nr:MAG: hypothetical protein M1833_003668 [Piccolia ochrophora]
MPPTDGNFATDDAVLEAIAKNGSLDFKGWPGLLEHLLRRIDQISHNDFPIPNIVSPPPPQPSTLVPASQNEVPSSQESSSQNSLMANKENAPPKSPTSRPPIPPYASSTADGATSPAADGVIPAPIKSILTSIEKNLTANFSTSPPHTIQRLAELVLQPRTHYRSLPSYLRALDRVVSVSSSADIFPLPTANMTGSPESGLSNGTSTIIGGGGSAGGLGSDESLGGALLTPIPWLRNDQQGEVHTESTEIVDGPNGVGSVETVSVSVRGVPSASHSQQPEPTREGGAVTQGELLRQEQEAGVIPVTQTLGRQTRSASARSEAEAAADQMEEDERPHARGPEVVGVEDMGPQEAGSAKGAFDVEAALGRKPPKKEDEAPESEKEMGDVEVEVEDEDIVLTDADGKPADEVEKQRETGDGAGADAVDTTTL